MTIKSRPGRPSNREPAREILQTVSFKADKETLAALKRIFDAFRRSAAPGVLAGKSELLRKLVLAEDARQFPDTKKTGN